MTTSVLLKQRQQSSKDKISLYLEFYKGTTINTQGKTVPVRLYESLRLYLIPNPKNQADKERNQEILELAKSVKAKREL
jgi:hypothetical protein